CAQRQGVRRHGRAGRGWRAALSVVGRAGRRAVHRYRSRQRHGWGRARPAGPSDAAEARDRLCVGPAQYRRVHAGARIGVPAKTVFAAPGPSDADPVYELAQGRALEGRASGPRRRARAFCHMDARTPAEDRPKTSEDRPKTTTVERLRRSIVDHPFVTAAIAAAAVIAIVAAVAWWLHAR